MLESISSQKQRCRCCDTRLDFWMVKHHRPSRSQIKRNERKKEKEKTQKMPTSRFFFHLYQKLKLAYFSCFFLFFCFLSWLFSFFILFIYLFIYLFFCNPFHVFCISFVFSILFRLLFFTFFWSFNFCLLSILFLVHHLQKVFNYTHLVYIVLIYNH